MVIKIAEQEKTSRVGDFYAGKSVLITGGTGFLGKVLIEKLLRSCKEIEKIYVLIRYKRGVSPDKRLEDIFNSPLFSKLREERLEVFKKIILISGDLEATNLAIKPEDEVLLVKQVSVVFHTAATVKFNEPLAQALKTNLEGTAEVLSLAQRMKNIQVFVYISTAYSHTDKPVIDEIIYPSPADINDVYFYVKQQEDAHGINILNGRPNTYTFSKALAESYIVEAHENLPTIIIRPSIVTAIKDGPVAGWVGNWYGATGILTMIAKGLNRVLCGRSENIIDLIPVDYVANFMIVAAAKSTRSNEVTVYNCCSSSCNPITLKDLIHMFVRESSDYILPFPKINFITMHKFVISIVTLLLQIVPAYLADFWRFLRGKPPRYVKYQSQVIQTRDALEYFTSNSWVMRCERARALTASLCSLDRQLFPFDPTNIDWTQYISKYSAGIQKYLVKDKQT